MSETAQRTREIAQLHADVRVLREVLDTLLERAAIMDGPDSWPRHDWVRHIRDLQKTLEQVQA